MKIKLKNVKGFGLVGMIVILAAITAITVTGYGTYSYYNFSGKKAECVSLVKSSPIKTDIVFDQNVNGNDIATLSNKLKQIDGVNVNVQSPEDVLAEFKEKHKDDAKNGVNQFLGDLNQLDKDNPFSYTIQISFALSDADTAAPKIKNEVISSGLAFQQPLTIDSFIKVKKSLLDVFSKVSFFDKPGTFLNFKKTNNFWQTYCVMQIPNL